MNNPKERRFWTNSETKAWLCCYNNRKREFQQPRKKKFAFSNILEDLTSMNVLESPLTADGILNKMKRLERAYKAAKDNINQTGESPKLIPFENELDEIFGDRPVCGRSSALSTMSSEASIAHLNPKRRSTSTSSDGFLTSSCSISPSRFPSFESIYIEDAVDSSSSIDFSNITQTLQNTESETTTNTSLSKSPSAATSTFRNILTSTTFSNTLNIHSPISTSSQNNQLSSESTEPNNPINTSISRNLQPSSTNTSNSQLTSTAQSTSSSASNTSITRKRKIDTKIELFNKKKELLLFLDERKQMRHKELMDAIHLLKK